MCLADRLNVLAIIFATVLCQQTPSIVFISEPQVVTLGSYAELKCGVRYLADYPLIWLKLPNNILAVGASKLVPDNHITMGFYPGSNLYCLQFRDIQEVDGGAYVCQILLTSHGLISANTSITIQSPPVITIKTNGHITDAGKDVILFCNATGHPKPKITWHRVNNILPTGNFKYYGHELKLFNIKEKDRGIYVCNAFNGIGKGDRQEILVSVKFAPEIYALQSSITAFVGKDIELMCYVDSYPESSISWYRNDENLNNNNHYAISRMVVSSGTIFASIRIFNIQEKDFATYTCQAINKLGTAAAEIIVKQL